MLTAKQAWIGSVVLLIVVLLVLAASIYWQHVTGTNVMHLLADGLDKPVPQGC